MPRASALVVVAELFQTLVIVDDDLAAIDADNAFLVQTAESTADRFDGEAEEVADVHARHRQAHGTSAEIATPVTTRQTEQQRGNAAFGVFLAEREHDLVVGLDLPAHQLEEMVLQAGNDESQFFEAIEGHLAH